jgi:hypothetical protein
VSASAAKTGSAARRKARREKVRIMRGSVEVSPPAYRLGDEPSTIHAAGY